MTEEIRKVLSIFGSQSRLARAIGVSNNAVCKWVKRGHLPPGRAIFVFNLVKDKRTPKGEYVSLESLLLDSSDSIKAKNMKDTDSNINSNTNTNKDTTNGLDFDSDENTDEDK